MVTTLADPRLVGAQANEMVGVVTAQRTKLHIRPAWWSRIGGDDCSRGGQYADERPGSEPSPLSSLWCLCRRPAELALAHHESHVSEFLNNTSNLCGRDQSSNAALLDEKRPRAVHSASDAVQMVF